MNLTRRITIGLAGAGLVFGLTACASTPDGEISEIEGAINGEVLEVWSQSARDHVEIAVVTNHDCQLGDIYYECLEPGEVLGRTDVPRYRGDGFDEESTETSSDPSARLRMPPIGTPLGTPPGTLLWR